MRTPEWWPRLGGPNAINVPAWVLTYIGGTAAAFTWIPRGTAVRWPEWVALSALAQLLIGAILVMAWMTYLSPRRRQPRPFATLLTLIVAGALRGAFLSTAGERSGLVSEGFVLDRTIGAAIAFTVWYAIFTLMVDAWRRHRTAMRDLTAAALREKDLAEREAGIVRTFRVELVERTEALLAAELAVAITATSQPTGAALTLQHTIDDVLRPLSHEMEQQSLQDDALVHDADQYLRRTRIPIRAYVVGIVTERPFAPVLTGIICLVTAPIVTLRVLGPIVGTLALAICSVGVGLGLAAVRRPILPRIPTWRPPQRAIAVVGSWLGVTALVGVALLAVFRGMGVEPDSWLSTTSANGPAYTVVAIVVMALTTMVVAAMEGSIAAQQQRSEQALRQAALTAEWAKARLRQRAAGERKRFGEILHGGVQARIVAAALVVEQQPPAQAARTIEGLADSIHEALGSEAESPWEDDLSDMSEVWNLAITLTFDISDEARAALDHDPLAARGLVSVVGEAITNAVRHGDADTVRVVVASEPGYLDVTVIDDGVLDNGSGEAGMGTRLYDVHFADWSLMRPSGTVLTGRIPCDIGRPIAEFSG